MAKHELSEIAEQQLELAQESPDGRSSQLLVGDEAGLIKQTVVALTEGNTVAAPTSTEHSTMQVLSGSVRVRTSDGQENVSEGDLVEVPTDPHVIRAQEDSAVLMTESKSETDVWDQHSG